MRTANSEVLSTNFEIFSTQGQAGSGAGAAYVPLKSGIFDQFMVSQLYPISANSTPAFNGNTLNTTNDFVFNTFLPSENIVVNRLLLRFSAATSPVLTVRAGVMPLDLGTGYPLQTSNVVAFLPGGFQDVSTATSFVAGNYTEFIFSSSVTLNAGTWYCAGLTISARTSGTVTVSNQATNVLGQGQKWPQSGYRVGTVASTFQSLGNYALGYNNGTSTTYYFGEIHDGGGSLNILPSANTQTQVGFRFELNLPVDEIFINKIGFSNAGINTSHSMVCKIYSDISGAKLIGSSNIITSNNLLSASAGVNRLRFYFFAPPVRIKPYKQYFAMLEVASGSPTAVGPSYLGRIGIEFQRFYCYDSNNIVAYRANSADANFTYSTSFIASAVIFFDTVRETPRPQVSSM
jgi:hypothetical protein